jgi:hypothetical protein
MRALTRRDGLNSGLVIVNTSRLDTASRARGSSSYLTKLGPKLFGRRHVSGVASRLMNRISRPPSRRMSSPTDSFLASKRPRVFKDKSGVEKETYESPDLWFDDGNIIIRTVLARTSIPCTKCTSRYSRLTPTSFTTYSMGHRRLLILPQTITRAYL